MTELETEGDSQSSVASRRADALLALVEAGEAADGSTGAPVSTADRYTVHVELNAGDDRPALRNGTVLSKAAIERLICDGALVAHTAGEDRTLDVGRRTRTVSGPLRRALIRRDKGCRFPGCTQSRFVDAHHVRHWAHGGETNLDNLLLLCSRHHGAVHDGRFRVQVEHPERGAARFLFFSSDGTRLLPTGDQRLAKAARLHHPLHHTPYGIPQVHNLPPRRRYRGNAVRRLASEADRCSDAAGLRSHLLVSGGAGAEGAGMRREDSVQVRYSALMRT
jgi:hypothetical protein